MERVQVGYALPPEDPVKKLTRLLLEVVKAIDSGETILFSTLDDSRPRPRNPGAALEEVSRVHTSSLFSSPIEKFTTDVYYLFRLLAFVSHENSSLAPSSRPLAARAAKLCIAIFHSGGSSRDAEDAVKKWEDHLRSSTLETKVDPSEVCCACKREVRHGETHVVTRAGKRFHSQCFRCVVCSQSLDGKQFALDGDDPTRPACGACAK